jgi:hypothetical protein
MKLFNFSSSPSFNYSKSRYWYISSFIIIVLINILCAFLCLITYYRIHKLQQCYNQLANEETLLTSYQEEYTKVTMQQKNTPQYQDHPISPSRVLTAVSRSIPDAARLHEYRYHAHQPHILLGYATQQRHIAIFQQQLAPYLYHAKIAIASLQKHPHEQGYEFTLLVELAVCA